MEISGTLTTITRYHYISLFNQWQDMGEPLPKKKSKLLTWTVVAIIAIIITSVVLYVLHVGARAKENE